MTEELKQKMKEGRAKAKLVNLNSGGEQNANAGFGTSTPGVKDTIREDFDKFKAESAKRDERIFGILETLVNKDKTIGQSLEVDPSLVDDPKVAVEDEIQELSGKQLLVFQKYFAEEDGFKAWYNVNENIFTIEVPMTLSNTTEAHRVLYKQDLRSRKVDQNNVLASMDQWARLVAQNLKYNKQIKLK